MIRVILGKDMVLFLKVEHDVSLLIELQSVGLYFLQTDEQQAFRRCSGESIYFSRLKKQYRN